MGERLQAPDECIRESILGDFAPRDRPPKKTAGGQAAAAGGAGGQDAAARLQGPASRNCLIAHFVDSRRPIIWSRRRL